MAGSSENGTGKRWVQSAVHAANGLRLPGEIRNSGGNGVRLEKKRWDLGAHGRAQPFSYGSPAALQSLEENGPL